MTTISTGVYPDGVAWQIVKYESNIYENRYFYELLHYDKAFNSWYIASVKYDIWEIIAERNAHIKGVHSND